MATRKNEVKVNLTPPFLIWTAVFTALALITGWGGWWWFAAAPWLFFFGFMLLAVVIGGVAFLSAWHSGRPLRVTTPRKGTRVIQRRR